jgi:hypothetical protein
MLTVTTATGETASDTTRVTFAQKTGDQSRAGCPGTALSAPLFSLPRLERPVAGTNKVSVTATCTTSFACSGVLLLSSAGSSRGSVRSGSAQVAKAKKHKKTKKKRKRAKRRILASKSFTIPAGATRKITAKLGKRSRRLLAKRRRIRARVSVLTFSQLGNKAGVRVKKVTLKAKKRKKKRKSRKRH